MPNWNLLTPGFLESICPTELQPLLLSDDYTLSKAAFAAALVLLLVLVRRSRPRQRVIFNF